MHPRNCGLDMIGREFLPARRALQQLFTFGEKVPIPFGAILIGQREQFAGRIGSCGKPRGVEAHQRRERVH